MVGSQPCLPSAPKGMLQLKAAGQALCADGFRVAGDLQARNPQALLASSGERHLQGCSMNRQDSDSAPRLPERRACVSGGQALSRP